MNDLSPELQELIAAGKLVARPTAVDRERVFAALQARLAAGSVMTLGIREPIQARSLAPIRTRRALTAKTMGVTAVAAVALAALTVGIVSPRSTAERAEIRDSQGGNTVQRASEPNAPAAVRSIEAVGLAPRDATWVTFEAKTSDEKVTRASKPARNKNSVRDTLAEEVAILSRAQGELYSGHAEKALGILAEHERRFRRGVLAEERRAAKIQALCAIGRHNEANALLSEVSPQSVTGESARQACALSRGPAKAP